MTGCDGVEERRTFVSGDKSMRRLLLVVIALDSEPLAFKRDVAVATRVRRSA